jgi:protein-disulfide isomerase
LTLRGAKTIDGARRMKTKLLIGASLAGAAVLGAIAVSMVSAQQSKPAAASDRKAIEAIVRDFIRDNPEIIVEALNAYSEQQEAEAAAASLPALLKEETAFIAGKNPAAAKVAVIELFDYHCGFCKRATPLVQDLATKDPAVKIIIRDLPLLRKESDMAARYALAAREQGKYLDYHFALLAQSGVLTEEKLVSVAKGVGLDTVKLKKDAAAAKLDLAIESNFQAAERMRLDGTPSFIVTSLDGDFMRVIPGLDEDAVRLAIAEAKKAKPAG